MMRALQLSRSQVDKLGQRLRAGDASDADIRLLDEYRSSFDEALQVVVGRIRDRIGLEPALRSRKTTLSIIEKLRRETMRLSQMQDIAGCRIIVPSLAKQDGTVSELLAIFPGSEVQDRRSHPSYGYRAVHVIVSSADKPIEVQIRSEVQHYWAEVSERFADEIGKDLKYGGGPAFARETLQILSDFCRDVELEDPDRPAMPVLVHRFGRSRMP